MPETMHDDLLSFAHEVRELVRSEIKKSDGRLVPHLESLILSEINKTYRVILARVEALEAKAREPRVVVQVPERKPRRKVITRIEDGRYAVTETDQA